MALLDWGRLAQNSEFKLRTKIAILRMARDIINETDPTLPEDAQGRKPASQRKYDKRQGLAFSMLRNPDSYVETIAFNIASVGTVTQESTDNDIEFLVSGAFNDIAAVTKAEREA